MDLLLFLVAIATIILVHEFGHFLACRLFKVEVEEFGLGFPPRILTLFRWQGTEFSLNWIPLGGFVRPKGENDPDVPGGLASAKPRVRLAVFFAGPLMNLIFAALLYTVQISQWGVADTSKVLIVEVAANSPAEQAGLRPGDQIVRINDKTVESIETVQQEVSTHKGQEISLECLREQNVFKVYLTPRLNPPQGQGALGIAMSNPPRPISLIQALPLGFVMVVGQGYQLLTLPVKIARGLVSAEEMRLLGYKGIYDIYQGVREAEVAQSMPTAFGSMAFFGLISASLGFFNLLPIPALDGGRILFTLPEIVLRRRVPPHLENVVHWVGLMLLLLLMVYVNIQDFLNPIHLTP